MTNTILTDEQIKAVWPEKMGENPRLDYARAIEAATVAALVERAGGEEVFTITPEISSIIPAGTRLYVEGAIASLQAKLEAAQADLQEEKLFSKQAMQAVDEMSKQRDILQAEVEAMRGQEPVAVVVDNGKPEGGTEWLARTVAPGDCPLVVGDKLYLAPTATPNPEATAGELTDDQWLEIAEKCANMDFNSDKPDGYFNAVKKIGALTLSALQDQPKGDQS